MTRRAALDDPRCEGFFLRLNPRIEEGIAHARAVVEQILGQEWQVHALADRLQAVAAPNSFDVLGPLNMPPAEAWQASYEIAAKADVMYAEPVFETDASGDGPPSDGDIMDFKGLGEAADPDDFSWSLNLIGAAKAWRREPPEGGLQFGEGIIIGHPDSGYVEHDELGPGLLRHLGRSFVESGNSAEHRDGAHGTGTASVIMSPDNRQALPRSVTGVAPKALLIPYRVAKKRLGVPSPVLFRSGMRRLRDAILTAIADECHVISISLGWLPYGGVHDAVVAAVRKNIIVIAAAGNYTYKLVIWPARYKEVLALAACGPSRQPWASSARGRSVDFTAPGHLIWRADLKKYIAQASGTSHATATAAGVAALWLAFWGRDSLLDRYRDRFTLSQVFRWVLKRSADDPPSPKDWGHGIINADRCLSMGLPTPAQLEVDEPKSYGAPPTGETSLISIFDFLTSRESRQRLARLLRVEPPRVDHVSHGREAELIFLILTNPEACEYMSVSAPAALDAIAPPPLLTGLSSSLTSMIAWARDSTVEQ